MIVPRFWAEGRAQQLAPDGKPLTVRRFGWSDSSPAEAQTMADARARETLALLVAGQPVPRHDRREGYNGADGAPIREEILRREGTAVVTRNGYGALCLNTPDVLFVDVDFREEPLPGFTAAICAGCLGVLLTLALLVSTDVGAIPAFLIVLLPALYLGLKLASRLRQWFLRSRGGVEADTLSRVRHFASCHPAWGLRVYRTPAGLRVLASHAPFRPDDPAVTDCFRALGADPVYVNMCLYQQCFRARLTPKPWRIGLRRRPRPRPGTWPAAPEHQTAREEWLARYEAAATKFAACTLLETLGNRSLHPAVAPVQELHDTLCRATSGFPIA